MFRRKQSAAFKLISQDVVSDHVCPFSQKAKLGVASKRARLELVLCSVHSDSKYKYKWSVMWTEITVASWILRFRDFISKKSRASYLARFWAYITNFPCKTHWQCLACLSCTSCTPHINSSWLVSGERSYAVDYPPVRLKHERSLLACAFQCVQHWWK